MILSGEPIHEVSLVSVRLSKNGGPNPLTLPGRRSRGRLGKIGKGKSIDLVECREFNTGIADHVVRWVAVLLTPRVLKLTASLLIVLTALVGGLGSGLHGLMGEYPGRCPVPIANSPIATIPTATSASSHCQHHCCASHRLAAPQPPQAAAFSATSGQEQFACPVCELLSQFRSATPWVPLQVTVQAVVVEQVVESQIATATTFSSLPTIRGPPRA